MNAELARRPDVGPPQDEDALIIEAGRGSGLYWRDLWRYRELFYVLAWRDLAVRYKQTVLGLAWAILRPLLTVAVFTLIFQRIANLPSEAGAPYALMVLAGVLPWQFFSAALAEASASLVSNSALITKVYFPRLIVPLAAIVVVLVDLLVSLALIVALMAWYRFMPGWQLLTLPFFIAMAFLASLGPALWLSSLNVTYRDFRHAIPFMLQLGLYISPVAFSSSLVPEGWRILYSLNPMVGVIDGFRWAILGGSSAIHWHGFLISWALIAVFLWLGVSRFRRTERHFADII
ncbi:MAG: ABC transporter permease [Usitatibacter sp.]